MTFELKTNLKAGETHPLNTVAMGIFNALPPEYITHIADQLETVLQEPDKQTEEVQSMGVVVETLRRLSRGDHCNDRYTMGAAIYLSSTLFNLAETTAIAFNNAMATREEDTGQEEEPVEGAEVPDETA